MLGAVLAKQKARAAYAAMSRKDLDAIATALADECVFEFPGQSVMSGRMEGKQAIVAWFRSWFAAAPRIQFRVTRVAVDNIFALGASNGLLAEWHLSETNAEGKTFEMTGVTALDVKRGKLVHVRDYIFNPQVLEQAWGRAHPPAAA